MASCTSPGISMLVLDHVEDTVDERSLVTWREGMASKGYTAGFEKGVMVATGLAHRVGFVEAAARARLQHLGSGQGEQGTTRMGNQLQKIVKACGEVGEGLEWIHFEHRIVPPPLFPDPSRLHRRRSAGANRRDREVGEDGRNRAALHCPDRARRQIPINARSCNRFDGPAILRSTILRALSFTRAICIGIYWQ